jgi:4-hydroxythreonine-4-phosphate dehydrogenase
MVLQPPMTPLAITMGDPAGIGPEIIARALVQRPDLRHEIVIAGDVPTLRRAFLAARLPEGEFDPICVQACRLERPVPVGRISAQAGQAAAECIAWAAQAALKGDVSAVVTAPIHKEALAAAGVPHPGHTEYLQALCAAHLGVPVDELPVRMMLSSLGLSTVLVSIHVALRDALGMVTRQRVLQTLRIAADHFARCGTPGARIAVAGLNPHAGEGGLFGREELDVIGPAVSDAQAMGLKASGPHAPDTVFMRARQGEFDVVIAMYHDQGLIPVKLLGLEHGVNTTLGLPIIRTSPDHGTAFDIAGTGQASPASLLAAIDAARQMVLGRAGA